MKLKAEGMRYKSVFFNDEPVSLREYDDERRRLHAIVHGGAADSAGIYRIQLNEKFYIGCADHLYKRIRSHISFLNCALNAVEDNGLKNSQINILKFLKDRPDYNCIHFYVLEECEKVDLYDRETFWLNYFNFHPNILNILWYSSKTPKNRIICQDQV